MKIVSFDIWDTILKRKCHPEEIKLHTAKYIWLNYYKEIKEEYQDIYKILKLRDEIEAKIGKTNKEKGKDEECTILDVFSMLQEEIFKQKREDISQELLRVEVEHEKRMIFLNPAILPIFEKYKDRKIYCISDFYMGKKELKELLESVEVPVKIEKIYSSADYLRNKKTGNLYKIAEEELNVKPADHIHVGDNRYSDIEMAQKLGIEAVQISKQEEGFSYNRNRIFQYNLNSIKKQEKTEKDKLFNIGVELSPILYFFGYSIIEYAIKNKIPVVNYCTREGETFVKIHELFQKNNPFGCEIPEKQILEVSRLATFSASLKEFSIMELLRIWSQYRNKLSMSMKTLYRSFDIAIEPYCKYMKKYNIDIEKPIYEPWFDERVQRLCEDKEFSEKMKGEFEKKRDSLLAYFEKEKGIKNDEEQLFLVDIGWRGTIQDNLAYIFTKKRIGGYYLALYDFYNRQPDNTYKLAFIDDKKILDEILNPMITLIEWIYSPGTGSVIRYEKGKAVRKAKKEELQVVEEWVKPLQEGMLAGAKLLNEYMTIHPYEAEETVKPVYELLCRLKEKPPKTLVTAYYQMVFNDTFGTDQYVEKNKKISLLTRINPIKCRRILQNETWKEAFMIYYHVGYMKILMTIKEGIRRLLGRK